MNTFIISSKDLEKALDEASKICKENKIDSFSIEVLEFEKALGIEDVRNIQKTIFLKPFKGEKKALIVKLLSGATVEAQNSMLKLLEEPPQRTLIFLVTDNVQIFLPTILSRTKIIELKNEEFQTNESGLEEILNLNGVGDRLYLAQVVTKDKNEAIAWLESAILAARERMLNSLENKQESLRLRKLVHKLELTHYDLKTTNVNPRLALENLFLNI